MVKMKERMRGVLFFVSMALLAGVVAGITASLLWKFLMFGFPAV
jgi:hypothetical protein